MDNQRRFSRIPFDANVIIRGPSGIWHSKMLDISLKGLLITRPANWPNEAVDEFRIEIRPPEAPFSIRMQAHRAHAEADHIGFECSHIDIDSISHLRRLVELNIGDEDVLNRELAEMAKAS